MARHIRCRKKGSNQFDAFFKKYKGVEIAEMLGISPAAVCNIKYRGKWPNTEYANETSYVDKIIKRDKSFTKRGLLRKI